MRLIIQNLDGAIYAYRESERLFKRNERQRGTPLLDAKKLDHECNLGLYDDFHMVLKIKKGKKK